MWKKEWSRVKPFDPNATYIEAAPSGHKPGSEQSEGDHPDDEPLEDLAKKEREWQDIMDEAFNEPAAP